MSRFAVILPAAGKSRRFSAQHRKKPFLELKGRAVWLRALEPFINREDVVQTLIVVAEEDREFFRDKFAPNLAFLNVEIVTGGAERWESVQRALARVRGDVDYVAVHDAARPLLVTEWVQAVFKAAEQWGAALPAVPVTNTLKRIDAAGCVVETIDRRGLFGAQTPQVARRDWLLDAYARRGTLEPTDEAQLLEHAGYAVHVVEGSPLNFKITTSADFKLAEVALDALPKPQGWRALHPFADEELRF